MINLQGTALFGYGYTPDAKPPMPPIVGADASVLEHIVGYTEVLLSNGDRLRFHLFIDRMVYDRPNNRLSPQYRLVPERIMARDSSMPEDVPGVRS